MKVVVYTCNVGVELKPEPTVNVVLTEVRCSFAMPSSLGQAR